MRKQIYNVSKSANDDLIEPQLEETNPGSCGGKDDSKIVLRRSQRERRPPKYLEDCEKCFNEYSNDVEKGLKGEIVS